MLHQHIFFILVWLKAEHLPMFLVSKGQRGAGARRILGINLEFLFHVKPLRKLLIIRSFKKFWPLIQINYGSHFNSILGAQSSMYNPMIIVVLCPHKKVIIWLILSTIKCCRAKENKQTIKWLTLSNPWKIYLNPILCFGKWFWACYIIYNNCNCSTSVVKWCQCSIPE